MNTGVEGESSGTTDLVLQRGCLSHSRVYQAFEILS